MNSSLPTYHIPSDRYYDRIEHMWVKPGPSPSMVKIGIDTLGLESLGDLAYISLNPVGTSVKRGESLGTLEAAKMTGDIISPISGVLVAGNEHAVRDPSIVNLDPYTAGWLVQLEPSVWEAESGQLVSGKSIPRWVDEEIERYKNQGWID